MSIVLRSRGSFKIGNSLRVVDLSFEWKSFGTKELSWGGGALRYQSILCMRLQREIQINH